MTLKSGMLARTSEHKSRPSVALGTLAAVLALTGCDRPEPPREYAVPEGASAEETSPGEPITPPSYNESSGLPGPPPGPPPVR